MAIMTLSGRAVKRPGRLIGAGQLVRTPQIVRALRRAKCPAPWAGWGCSMTDAGLAAGADAEAQGESEAHGAAALPTPARTPGAAPLTWEQVCAAGDSTLAAELRRLGAERDAAETRGDAGAVASLLGRIDDIDSEVAQRRAWRKGAVG